MNMDHEKLLDRVSERYFKRKQLEEFQRIIFEANVTPYSSMLLRGISLNHPMLMLKLRANPFASEFDLLGNTAHPPELSYWFDQQNQLIGKPFPRQGEDTRGGFFQNQLSL